jgi:regulatory protein
MDISKKSTDKSQARTKAEHFCAYQERSQQEVRDKLYSFGLHSAQVEELISGLIQSNFLNEERFATAYALGKFRIKHWGRNKIKQGLRFKQVPEKMISKVLKHIDQEEYIKTLGVLLDKKAGSLHSLDKYELQYKLTQYAVGKGYEKELVRTLLHNQFP